MPEPADLLAFNLGLRGAIVALSLLAAALLLRDHPRSLAARLGALLSAGTAAYAVSSAPGFGSPALAWPLLALAGGNQLVFWLLARALFSDGFVLRWWHGLAWATLAGTVLVICYVLMPRDVARAQMLGASHSFVNLALTALALLQALATWRSDLVEGRRRLRIFVVGVAGVYGLVNAAVQVAVPPVDMPALANVVNAAGLLLAVVVIVWPLLRVTGGELFVVERQAAEGVPAVPQAIDTKPPASPDPADVAALERLMRTEHVYREEGLTIGALAARLGVPEYKLRRLINQGLGYRNFNAYLNHYRLDHAKAALADPAQADVPVLEIAMDAGFQSLGPFNRAFKADTGVTPSEFRQGTRPSMARKTTPMLADSEIG
jgi:AraC-like DNA-binding protein